MSATGESPDLLRLRDPLSEVTRKERRSLLGVSMLSLAVAVSGLLPTEIAALGVKLESKEQASLLVLLIAVCFYYVIAFLAYAASDFTAWLIAIRQSIEGQYAQLDAHPEDEYRFEAIQTMIAKHFPMLVLADAVVRPVSQFRVAFEFGLPVVVGLFAILVLIGKVSNW